MTTLNCEVTLLEYIEANQRGSFVRFEVSTAVTMMIIISQKMIIIKGEACRQICFSFVCSLSVI
jgi:hypothetical protein